MDNLNTSPSYSIDKEETKVVHIYSLPDELLLDIFTKLNDAKSLCICILVSKRFSNLVLQTPSIFLTFPNTLLTQQNQNFSKKLLNYFSKPFFRYLQKPRPPQFDNGSLRAAVESLKHFKNVRNLRIELPSFQQDDSIVKWHAEFGKECNICVILFARKSTSDKTPDPNTPLTNSLLQSRIALANQCFREAAWRQHVLRHVAEDHSETLETAEITDSRRKGRLVMREKRQIVDLLDPEVKLPPSGYGKLWHVQVLRLPQSGCVLDGVTVVAIRRTEENEQEYDDVGVKDLMNEGFNDDEELVLKEVLSHIFENDAPSRSLNINARR